MLLVDGDGGDGKVMIMVVVVVGSAAGAGSPRGVRVGCRYTPTVQTLSGAQPQSTATFSVGQSNSNSSEWNWP